MNSNFSIKTLFNIPIASITMEETLDIISSSIDENRELQHVVVNAGKIVAMQSDAALRESVLDADLINADGQAVVWASKILGKPLPERVAGIDLMMNLVKMAYEKGYKCYFLGAKEEVVKTVVDVFTKQYSSDIIGGYRNGYFTVDDEEDIARDIAASGAQMLFVAISSPKKETFVNQYKSIMNVPFVMGVGGSFDVVAGVTKRAPIWMQKMGLEWFYRFLQEPGRMWRRYLYGNVGFIKLVIKERFKKQH